jgi:hypothetical protein
LALSLRRISPASPSKPVPNKQSVPGSGMLARTVECLALPAFELNCAAWVLLAIGVEFPAPAGSNRPPAPGCSELLSAQAAVERAIANRITKNRLTRKTSEMFDIDRCFDADLAAQLP